MSFAPHLIHFANVLFLSSYLVRDILWLRVLTTTALCCLLPYYYFRTNPLFESMGWNSVSICINLVQITLLILERRPVYMSSEERVLYKMVFRSLTPREFKRLIRDVTWKDAEEGDCLIEQGDKLEYLIFLVSGRCSVFVDGEKVAEVKGGQFAGEMSFLTGDYTSARVIALEKVRYICWEANKLKDALDKKLELRATLQLILGADLVGKLRKH